MVIGEIIGSVLKMGVVEICCVIEVVDKVLLVWCVLIVKECVNKLCCWFDLMIEN